MARCSLAGPHLPAAMSNLRLRAFGTNYCLARSPGRYLAVAEIAGGVWRRGPGLALQCAKAAASTATQPNGVGHGLESAAGRLCAASAAVAISYRRLSSTPLHQRARPAAHAQLDAAAAPQRALNHRQRGPSVGLDSGPAEARERRSIVPTRFAERQLAGETRLACERATNMPAASRLGGPMPERAGADSKNGICAGVRRARLFQGWREA